MTSPLHRRYLSEVGADLASFATESEVIRVQEELAYHLEEKKYILLDRGLSEEEAEALSLADLGSHKQFAKDVKAALSGPIRYLNAASLLAGSSFFLAFPLAFLAVKGFFSVLLGALFALVAFFFAVSGVRYGAKITLTRTILVGLVAGVSFLVPLNDIIMGEVGSVVSVDPSQEVRFIPTLPVQEPIEYQGSDGQRILVSPGVDPIEAVMKIQSGPASKGSPPLPDDLQELLTGLAEPGPDARKVNRLPSEVVAGGSWVLSCGLIALAAAAASVIGERIRSSKDVRTHLPPPVPEGDPNQADQ